MIRIRIRVLHNDCRIEVRSRFSLAQGQEYPDPPHFLLGAGQERIGSSLQLEASLSSLKDRNCNE